MNLNYGKKEERNSDMPRYYQTENETVTLGAQRFPFPLYLSSNLKPLIAPRLPGVIS